MFYLTKYRDDLKNLNNVISLQNQVKALRVQYKLRKENIHGKMKKVFEPVTGTIKDVFEDVTRTIKETSLKNNKTPANLNDKLLELMNDSGILSSHLLSSLSKIINTDHTSQFKLIKDPQLNRVNGLLLNKTIPVLVYNKLLTFRDTDKKFELQENLLKMTTIKKYIVGLAKLLDKKLSEFAKEMYFDAKTLGNKSTRELSLIRLLNLPAVMARSLEQSNTRWLSFDANDFFNRLNLLLREKQAGNISNIINEKIVAVADKLLEYKSMSTKRHKFLQLECLN